MPFSELDLSSQHRNRKLPPLKDADSPEVKEGKLFTLAVFKQAIVLYNSGNLSEAAQLFSHCLHLNPGDKVAKIYLERCQQQETVEAFNPNI